MAIEIKMPALSPTMEEGTLAKWLKSEGDEIVAGDIIAEIETDKATMEFEAVDEGTLGKIMIEEGTEGVKVGTVIAMLAGEGEDASDIEAPAQSGEVVDVQGEGKDVGREESEAEITKPKPKPKADVRDPDVPEGTSYTSTSVREALRDGMAEEMRRDERVS